MTVIPLAAKETPNSADSNISEASLVYICNTTTSAGTVTLKTSGGVAIATIDVPASGSLTIKKKNAEKIRTSAATLTVTAIGYAN
tara:strand:- start:5479 stop:5733 length:255 start_codon:yes stop_codon:yes gene_type:complete